MASGNDLCRWNAAEAVPPATNFGALVRRNNHMVVAFDGTTQESVYFEDTLPDTYAGGGLTLTLFLIAASATTGDCVFEGAIERQDTGTDLDADSFATAQGSGAVTVAGTAGQTFTATITFTSGANMDSLAAGERFRLLVRRAPANASDNVATDVQLTGVRIRET